MLRGFLVDPRQEAEMAETWKKKINIRTPDVGNNILSLSGGNQQKALFARALGSVAGIVLMDDPMRGVDIGTKQEVYDMIRTEAERGRTFIWYTTEMDELKHCDHVYVFRNGRIVADLARGELMQRRGAWNLALEEDEYFRRCGLKTGRLFAAACVLGRGSVEPAGGEAIGRFGHRIGIAFQLLDDVLDISGPPERTGKARGTDLLDGTVTLPLIDAIRTDAGLAEIDLRALDAEGAAAVCDRIEATGALDRVRATAIGLIERAKADLDGLGIEPGQRELLELIADGVVSRYS